MSDRWTMVLWLFASIKTISLDRTTKVPFFVSIEIFNDRVIIQSKGVFHISKKFAAYLTVLINSEIHESALPRLDIANRKLQQK